MSDPIRRTLLVDALDGLIQLHELAKAISPENDTLPAICSAFIAFRDDVIHSPAHDAYGENAVDRETIISTLDMSIQLAEHVADGRTREGQEENLAAVIEALKALLLDIKDMPAFGSDEERAILDLIDDAA